MRQHRSEQLPLARRSDVRNDDHQSGMEFFSRIQRREIRPVVGDKRVVLAPNPVHQLPVFLPPETEEVYVLADVSGLMRQRYQRRVKALID